jgi:hypothetical protein
MKLAEVLLDFVPFICPVIFDEPVLPISIVVESPRRERLPRIGGHETVTRYRDPRHDRLAQGVGDAK